jgi:hypothetical protein
MGENTKRITLDLTRRDHERMKLAAIPLQTTMAAILRKLVSEYFRNPDLRDHINKTLER